MNKEIFIGMKSKFFAGVIATFLSVACLYSAEPAKVLIKDNDRLAMLGDSITAHRRYAGCIDAYITMCSGLKNIKVFNFGLGGDFSDRAAKRVDTYVFEWWKPTFMTVNFGMNHAKPEPFKEGMEQIVTKAQNSKCGVLIAAPSIVDSFYYQPAKQYDSKQKLLGEFADVDKAVAQKYGVAFADLYHPMLSVMPKAKEKYGEKYSVAGTDGYHPTVNGHLLMANEILKTLGFDGNIAEIELDWKSGATVSEGHKLLSCENGVMKIESSRYPFCFDTENPYSHDNMASILPFTDFQDKLNRFTLRVKNLPFESAKVQWGAQSRTFSKTELEKGINLADVFRLNPFSGAFRNVREQIAKKGYFETIVYCYITPNLLRPKTEDFAEDSSLDGFIARTREDMKAQHEILDGNVRKAFVPVTHVISVSKAD